MADLRNEGRTSQPVPQSLAAATFSHVRDLGPRRRDYAGLRSSWKGDVIAGLTVGVVALPLALAFGITTGLGA
ncbi:MAG: sulfate permease, SulP family, partial [Ilumatobacteraceae bacterium]